MSATNAKERPDAFPLMLALLAVLSLFYVLRPPLLLLWHQVFGATPVLVAVATTPVTSTISGRGASVPAVPITPPPLPASLTAAVAPPRWTPFTPTADMAGTSARIIDLGNSERTQRGLTTLTEDPQLSAIALLHSRDMVQNEYMAHTSRDGDGPAQRVGRLHRTLFGTVGENVALFESAPGAPDSLAAQFISQWMNSLPHRRNLLDATFTHIGVGCFDAPGSQPGVVMRKCTQLFGKVVGYAAVPVPDVVAVGAVLPLRVLPAKASAPNGLVQVDLATDRMVLGGTTGTLRSDGGGLDGSLTITGPAGLYSVGLTLPDATVSGRFWTLPGPYVQVR